jgi:acyl carrier protein
MSVKLYDIIARVMGVPISRINGQSSPKTIETWDSIRTMVLLDELETAFQVNFTLDDIVSIMRVQDIINILQRQGAKLDV